MTIDQSLVTTALIQLLEAAPGSFAVGDHISPPGANPRVAPYGVVKTIAGGSFDGPPLWDPEADVTLVYQVDAVGFTRPQAQALAARFRTQITGRKSTGGAYLVAITQPAGMRIHDRISEGTSGGVIVEGTAPDEIYSVPDRYLLTVTPA